MEHPFELLIEIFQSGIVQDKADNLYKLHSGISKAEGQFIVNLITKNRCLNALEIGLAYGVSGLYICGALKDLSAGVTHTAIDPYQNTHWKGIGVENLKRTGVDFSTLIEKPSEIALPELYKDGKQFDFILIDGFHTFDHTLLDLFYTSKLLKIGGLILIDDVLHPAVNKAARYVLNYPAFQLEGFVPAKLSWKRKLLYLYQGFFHWLHYVIPFSKFIFSGQVINPDKSLRTNSTMIAIKKIGEDNRAWNWYMEF